MMKFWEKTKKTVAIGINSIQEATGTSSLEEDSSYLEIYNKIKESEQKLSDLQSSIQRYSKYVSKMSSAQFTLSGQIASLFSSDDKLSSTASAAQQAQEQIYTNSRNLSQNYLHTHLINKIILLQKELEPILVTINKRKKNHVLLVEAQKDLTRAKSKGKIKDIAEYQEKAAKRQEKFNQYNDKFNTTANEFLSKLPAAYEDLFNSFQFYVTEYYVEGEKQLTTKVPGYDFESQKSRFPSITQTPPTEVQPTN